MMRSSQPWRRKQMVPWNVSHVLGGASPPPHGGKNVRVGIIDTGIDLKHPDLAANIKGGINLIEPHKPPQDGHGHGTHIAGIIGACDNSFGVVGIAPSVSLFAIKALNDKGKGSLSRIILGIEWAVCQQLDILNISFNGNISARQTLADAVKKAVQHDLLLIISAGNNGRPSGSGDTIEWPARLPLPLTVGALTRRNHRAPFSAAGPKLDICAPGVQILSTFPNKRLARLSGTSMAAAHVTGVAALLKQARPRASSLKLRRILKKQALQTPGTPGETGAGLVQYRG